MIFQDVHLTIKESDVPAQRIDFKYIRQHADIAKVLAHYGCELTKDGGKQGQFKAQCPFHDDHKPSLKVNAERNIYHCFVCEAGGNIIDLVMHLEGLEVRSAAKLAAELSGIATTASGKPVDVATKAKGRRRPRSKPETQARQASGRQSSRDSTLSAAEDRPVNPPLTFALKNLITKHPFVQARGISTEMQELFGVGVATRGIMKDRLVFPIHNANGELVAYCGRFVSDDIPGDAPKYLLPSGFKKELELFNWHRVKDEPGPLVLVESYFSVLKLHELGCRCASPMGRSLSEEQIALLSKAAATEVVLLFDGDDPGRAAVTDVSRRLLAYGFDVIAPVVTEDFKPHNAPSEPLLKLFASNN